VIDRKIQWLNDFSGEKKKINIVFKAPSQSDHLLICYRINDEVPVKSNCKYLLLPTEKATLYTDDSNLEENFSIPNNFVLPASRELTSKEEDELEKKLVWLFASPRSGTTWLSRDLLRNAMNIRWHEPKIVSISSGFQNIVGLENGDLLVKEPLHEKLNRPSYFFSNQYSAVWSISLRKLILTRAYAHAQTTKKNIIIKEVIGDENLNSLMTCFPNSKMIFLVRDGRDVIDSKFDMHSKNSYLVKKGKELLPLDSHEKRLRMIRHYASKWNVAMSNICDVFKKHKPKLRLNVRYEDLRKNTVIELGRLSEIISEAIDPPGSLIIIFLERF